MTSDPQALFSDSPAEKPRKRKKAKSKQVFKPYQQQQVMLLPPSLEEMIPAKHLVRVVNETIDKLNIEPLIATYKGDGTSAYHPLMMLKVLIYAYLTKTYASRMIAKALDENIHFMWLAGMSHPDFRTINTFRSSRLKEVIDRVFGSMVLFLLDHGYIDLQHYYIDGTKLRADNNKHKVVWAKNAQRYKAMALQKIQELLAEIERTNAEEQERYGDRDLEERGESTALTSDRIKEQVNTLNEIIQHTAASKHTVRVIKEIETTLLPNLEKYEQQEKTLAGRNSYARTDPDVTVFRTKEGQLLPAYNLLLGTQRQFVIAFSFHQQKASENDAFPAHLKCLHALLGCYPNLIMGDSAYGSEENYTLLAKNNIGNYLKYNTFHFEKTKKCRSNPYRKENFLYDEITDTYCCPQGKVVAFKQIRSTTTTTGYKTFSRLYQCVDCRRCPVANQCKRGNGPRSILINLTLDAYRAQARENLNSDQGIALRKQRGCDVEPTFGDIKFNQNYNRCRLRGQSKMKVEIGLLSMAHNTKKIARWIN